MIRCCIVCVPWKCYSTTTWIPRYWVHKSRLWFNSTWKHCITSRTGKFPNFQIIIHINDTNNPFVCKGLDLQSVVLCCRFSSTRDVIDRIVCNCKHSNVQRIMPSLCKYGDVYVQMTQKVLNFTILSSQFKRFLKKTNRQTCRHECMCGSRWLNGERILW